MMANENGGANGRQPLTVWISLVGMSRKDLTIKGSAIVWFAFCLGGPNHDFVTFAWVQPRSVNKPPGEANAKQSRPFIRPHVWRTGCFRFPPRRPPPRSSTQAGAWNSSMVCKQPRAAKDEQHRLRPAQAEFDGSFFPRNCSGGRVGQTSGLPVRRASGPVFRPHSAQGAGGSLNRQTGGLPHA